MKRYRLAISIFLSLLLHIALLFLFIQQNHLGYKKGSGEHRIKASFREIAEYDLERSAPVKKQIPAPNKQKKTSKKTPQSKQADSKPTLQKVQEDTKKKEELANNQEIQEQEKTNAESPQDLPIQENEQDSKEISPAMDFKQSLAYQFADASTKKNISEFYGPEFGYLGKEEQEFIINNLAYIGRITQKYLRYPANAAMLQQGGGNVVEFYLHPNGDISDLKIIKKSGFILLDKNSIKTIEIAYKDYPRPKTKTLIRFYINYFIRYR